MSVVLTFNLSDYYCIDSGIVITIQINFLWKP